MKSKLILQGFATCLFLLVSTASFATIITFAPLVGGNGSPYAGHLEGGFSVTNGGSWLEAQAFGNPTPSIFTNASTDSINVTETITGLFTFAGVDMACNNGSNCGYNISGFNSAVQVLSLVGSVTAGPPFNFFTVATGGPATLLDSLTISMTRGSGTTSMNIDNINVSSASGVPAPMTITMLLLGLAGIRLYSRSRS